MYRPLIKATAIRYAELGLSVIPIHPKTKVPCLKWKRFQETAATPHELKRIFGRFPNAQIGIITGSVPGLMAVDFDGAGVKEGFH